MIENVRIKELRNLIITLLIGAIIEVLLFFYASGSEYYFLVAMFVLVVCIGIASSFNTKYKNFYKQNVLKPVFEKYNLLYNPNSGISEELANKSMLLPEYDEYISSDLIKGDDFVASNIKLYRYRRSTDREDKELKEVVYSAMMIITKSNRLIKNPFIIKNNSFYLCKVLPFCIDKERQRLDDSEFEKFFDVFGGDMVEVREILTHDVMHELVNLKKQLNIVEISLVGNERFASLNRFELIKIPSIFQKYSPTQITKIEKNIKSFIQLVKFLQRL